MSSTTESDVINFKDSPFEMVSNVDMTGAQATYHVLSQGLSMTSGLVADYVELPPGFVHAMHKHPHADQILIPLTGVLTFETDRGASQAVAGDIAVARRNNWHEIRNESTQTMTGLVMFLGVSDVSEVGYESRP